MRVLCINNSPFSEEFADRNIQLIDKQLPVEGESYSVVKQHVENGRCFYELAECSNLKIESEESFEGHVVSVVFDADCFIPLQVD